MRKAISNSATLPSTTRPETPALRDINLKIAEGKTVALVGRSGSGKSTIANLLTRFYDIREGEILMDGHDLREYTRLTA